MRGAAPDLPLFGETASVPQLDEDTAPLPAASPVHDTAAAARPMAPADSPPIVAAAWPLLELLARLRLGATAEPGALKRATEREIRRFEMEALRGGATPETVLVARYALCTAIDEGVLQTPWGDASDWASASLLSIFHKETWGGEKVFALVERVLAAPAKERDLALLLFHLLSLGFQGRYRLRRDGTAEVEALRDRLHAALRGGRAPPPPLAEVPAPTRPRRRLTGYVPVWAAFAVCGLLAILLFFGLEWLLLQQAEALAPRFDAIHAGTR